MLDTIKSNPVYRFLSKAFILFLLWYLIYEFLLAPTGIIDRHIIDNLIFFSKAFLKLLGYPTIEGDFQDIRTVGIDGTSGVWVGDSCDGLTIFAIFSIVIICYPGPVKKKLWFIPLGILLIHILNFLRIAALAMILYHRPQSLDFNHTYTFTIIIYGFIFMLWMIWANRLSIPKKQKKID